MSERILTKKTAEIFVIHYKGLPASLEWGNIKTAHKEKRGASFGLTYIKSRVSVDLHHDLEVVKYIPVGAECQKYCG